MNETRQAVGCALLAAGTLLAIAYLGGSRELAQKAETERQRADNLAVANEERKRVRLQEVQAGLRIQNAYSPHWTERQEHAKREIEALDAADEAEYQRRHRQ